MSENNEIQPEVQKPSVMGGAKIGLSMADLQTIITTAVKAATDQSNDKLSAAYEQLAGAILESRKPYVDPRTTQNEATMRTQMKAQREKLNAALARDRENCAHKQGSNGLSEFQGALGSFAMHRLDTGEVIGVCTNCQKIIRSSVPSDRQWFKGKNAGHMSMAGQGRYFEDPKGTIERGRLLDEKTGATATGY